MVWVNWGPFVAVCNVQFKFLFQWWHRLSRFADRFVYRFEADGLYQLALGLGAFPNLDLPRNCLGVSNDYRIDCLSEYKMNHIESMLPSSEQIGHWEDKYFDEGENFDALLIEAYKAGYQACEAKYEAAMAEIVNPLDLGIDFQDDNE